MLELAAIASTLLLIVKTTPQLSQVPPRIRLTHWILIGIYLVLASGPVRLLIRLCAHHDRFTGQFSGENVLGLAPLGLQMLALAFTLSGAAFCASVFRLGNLSRKARSLFTWLVIPVSALYPAVMPTAFGLVGAVPFASGIALLAFPLLIGLGCFSIAFYNSKAVNACITFS